MSSDSFLFKIWRHPRGKIGIIIMISVVILALGAPFFAPFDPYNISERGPRLLAPQRGYLLGTDGQGIDILSKVIYGARISLIIGLSTGLLVTFFGGFMGVLAGYMGGWIDNFVMRFCDVIFVIPGLPLIILLASYVGTRFYMIIVIFTLLGWAGVARLIRSQVLSLRSRDYVLAAKALGAKELHIMLKHILPAVSPLLIINGVLIAAGTMVAEAGLSFLGFGDPLAISWGKMLQEAQSGHALFFGSWWWIIPPGLAIFVTVLGMMLFGYALEEILNPSLKKR